MRDRQFEDVSRAGLGFVSIIKTWCSGCTAKRAVSTAVVVVVVVVQRALLFQDYVYRKRAFQRPWNVSLPKTPLYSQSENLPLPLPNITGPN